MTLPPNPERLAEAFLRANPRGWTERQARQYAADAFLDEVHLVGPAWASAQHLVSFTDSFLDSLQALLPKTR